MSARVAAALRAVLLRGLPTLVLLVACTAPGNSRADAGNTPLSMPTEAQDRLWFESLLSDIQADYLEPVPTSRLAEAGLAALTEGDDEFRIVEIDGHVHAMLEAFDDDVAMPGPDNVAGWADILAREVAFGRRHGALIAVEDGEEVRQSVFAGMMPDLDRFSRLASGAEADSHRDTRDGYGGVGMSLNDARNGPSIAKILPAGPAARAGLLPGDELLALDGKSLAGVTAAAASRLLRGPEDSEISLTLGRSPAPNWTVELKRSLILPPTVTVEFQRNRIAALQISYFNAGTAGALAEAIRSSLAGPQPPLGFILDLRGNPGGLLDQAVDVASLFLDKGLVVAARGRNPASSANYAVDPTYPATSLPLVVLVDGGTASAAEIVAAALLDSGRAVVVGSSSFGKGTVQNVLDLPGGDELTLTWARLFPPGGYVLHHHGIVPLFCTSSSGYAGPASAAQIIAAGQTALAAGTQTQRRRLGEADWQALRADCPPHIGPNPLDIDVAERLLGAPSAYRGALAPAQIVPVPPQFPQSASSLPWP